MQLVLHECLYSFGIMMEHSNVKSQLLRWLTRRSPANFAREVADIPVAIASDMGNSRKENQDRVAIMKAQVSKSKSFIVAILCDGMGGMASGEHCAALAVASFLDSCIKNRGLLPYQRILNAAFDANNDVYSFYRGEGGATLTAVILESDGTVAGVNLGDSRLYEITGPNVTQLSIDDTLAARLENSKNSDSRLLQFIGMGLDIQPNFIDLPSLSSEKSYVLTSDGLHYIEQHTLKQIIAQKVTPIELARRLVHVAKWCGGQDNLSLIIISDLKNLFCQEDHNYSGTVQVWDHFGELFLIGVEKSNDSNQDQIHQKSESVSPDNSNINSESSSKKSRARKTPKKVKKEDDSQLTTEPQKSDKPQFKMDFDNE